MGSNLDKMIKSDPKPRNPSLESQQQVNHELNRSDADAMDQPTETKKVRSLMMNVISMPIQ